MSEACTWPRCREIRSRWTGSWIRGWTDICIGVCQPKLTWPVWNYENDHGERGFVSVFWRLPCNQGKSKENQTNFCFTAGLRYLITILDSDLLWSCPWWQTSRSWRIPNDRISVLLDWCKDRWWLVTDCLFRKSSRLVLTTGRGRAIRVMSF